MDVVNVRTYYIIPSPCAEQSLQYLEPALCCDEHLCFVPCVIELSFTITNWLLFQLGVLLVKGNTALILNRRPSFPLPDIDGDIQFHLNQMLIHICDYLSSFKNSLLFGLVQIQSFSFKVKCLDQSRTLTFGLTTHHHKLFRGLMQV